MGVVGLLVGKEFGALFTTSKVGVFFFLLGIVFSFLAHKFKCYTCHGSSIRSKQLEIWIKQPSFAHCQPSQRTCCFLTHLFLHNEVVNLLTSHEVSQLLNHLLPLSTQSCQGVRLLLPRSHVGLVVEGRVFLDAHRDES